MSQFYTILQRVLKEKDLSQVDAAQLTGIERKTFNSYYTGRTEPDLNTLKKIAKALQIENEIFYFITEQNVPQRVLPEHSLKAEPGDEGVYSKLLQEKEARRLEAVETIKELRADKEKLYAALGKNQETIDGFLNTIAINLGQNREALADVKMLLNLNAKQARRQDDILLKEILPALQGKKKQGSKKGNARSGQSGNNH